MTTANPTPTTGTIVITGARGFIGLNLATRLRETGFQDVQAITRETSEAELAALLARASFVFHLAGVNRPLDPAEFATGNVEVTRQICAVLTAQRRVVPLVYTSSTQAEKDNPYGRSKASAEQLIGAYGRETGSPVFVYRLPNVFGKWSRPNYNSAVATFCHNIARGLPIQVNDPTAPLTLAYIDDVVEEFLKTLSGQVAAGACVVAPTYQTTVGEVAALIQTFHRSRSTLMAERVGTGLVRALHATYLSFLPPDAFAYPLTRHADVRGVFVEMLKTPDCGQFSFFTAHPGITRGGHYHHTKSEKFLVIKGRARFGFRHVVTGEKAERLVDGEKPEVVETVPGWIHDVTNVGDNELVVMLWANEVFDRARPDTYIQPV